MKKILTLLFSLLLLVCLSSCTSCSTQDVPPNPTAPVTSSSSATDSSASQSSADTTSTSTTGLDRLQIFSGDTWEIYIPVDWKLLDHSDSNIVLSATLEDNKTMLVLVKETHDDPFDMYVLTAIRGLRATGADLIASEKQEINGTLWMYLEAEKNSILIYTWATVQDGFGYALSCGGPADNDYATNREMDCNEIMQSLKLK